MTACSGSSSDRPGPSPLVSCCACRSRCSHQYSVVARRRRRQPERVDVGGGHVPVQFPASVAYRRRRSTSGGRGTRRRRRRPGVRVRRPAGRRRQCQPISDREQDRPFHRQLHSVRPPAEPRRYELLDQLHQTRVRCYNVSVRIWLVDTP